MGDRKLGYFVADKLDDALQHLQQAAAASSKAEHYLITRPVNIDQGAQFTAQAFTDTVLAAGVKVSMDGRGRALDNIFIERLRRSVKYERIYLMSYATGSDLRAGLTEYFGFYNSERPHQSLGYRTPKEVHCA